ncbi:hypothetical protein [Laribacter hongkongensis]|uniref:hypothetical protein n=1 Tax=Laribacter hongkongensis TaxID=168471 RepID=UPI001EFCA8C3|nr:hypothetical protein [Laribacter hongkongensis]MCG9040003.1 hypothetical protein [Laribacter hongkongensis]MCG9068858.1 hypothetical protein [Laribacter hongkongensis]
MPAIGYQWLAKAHDIVPAHPFAVQSTIGGSRTTMLENDIQRKGYAMQGSVLRLRLRAATAGYALRCWSVDCSPDHGLRAPEFRLWLKDPLVLYGVQSASLAPSYRTPGEAA